MAWTSWRRSSRESAAGACDFDRRGGGVDGAERSGARGGLRSRIFVFGRFFVDSIVGESRTTRKLVWLFGAWML